MQKAETFHTNVTKHWSPGAGPNLRADETRLYGIKAQFVRLLSKVLETKALRTVEREFLRDS
jgi:hypothetical protein